MEIEFVPADPMYAEWWFEDRKDPESLLYNPLMPSTVQELRERLSKTSSDLAKYHTTDCFFWIIKSNNDVVGHITLQNINKTMLTAEIGYGVSRKFRGKGIATQTIRQTALAVFDQTPLRKIIAFVHEKNFSSIKVLERVGFQREGLLREHFLVNGIPTNEIVFGLLRNEII